MKKLLKKLFPKTITDIQMSAFLDAQKDLLEIVPDNYFKDKLDKAVTEKMLELLSPIDWDKVVQQDAKTRQLFIGTEVVQPARLANLKAEARFLLESDIWKLLYETPKAEAMNSMFIKSDSLIDLQKGKTMLFVLSQQENIINKFK